MSKRIAVLGAMAVLAGCATQTADEAPALAAARLQSPPPAAAETRPVNQAGYSAAFAGQTRAPAFHIDAPVAVTEVIPGGLDNTFGFAFLPDGSFLVTERKGQFRIISADGKLSDPVPGAPEVAFNAQGGLLDVVLDPDFARNQTIYFSFAEPKAEGGNHTAVAKAKLVRAPAAKIENVEVIYRQSPSMNSPLHFGSRLVFGRDGALFVTMGERSLPAGRVQSRDLNSGLGKVVRIHTDGSAPRDNPFIGRSDAQPEIWSSGHRNVQGAFLHPRTGELWTVEHGPQGGDEINIARKGKDYGWPSITYGVEYGRELRKIGEGITQTDGAEQPLYYWDPVIAPGGMTYYSSNLIPQWTGSVFVAGLNSGYIARLTMDGDTIVGEERITVSANRERYRDIDQGPDGALYVLTDGFGGSGRLLKIAPSADGQVVGVKAWEPPPPVSAPPAQAAAPAAPPLPPLRDTEAGAELKALVTLPAKDGAKLTVTTPGWKDGENIDFRFTQYQGNTFPGLEWSAGPAGTKSYAIIMQDTDFVARGAPILHWSVVNIPADVTKLAQGMAPEGKPAAAIYGPNYQGQARPYLGPRTPPGFRHRYHMQVFALDTVLPADFAPANYDELIAPLKGHVLASGSVMGMGRVDPAAPPPAPRAN